MKVILFNGPPRCGKDTAADIVEETIPGIWHMKFATAIKDGTHASLGIRAHAEEFDLSKDVRSGLFLGSTPREAYIKHSTYMKATYGEDIWAQMLMRELDRLQNEHGHIHRVVVSDCGFLEECTSFAKQYKAENIRVIRIRRPGHDFSNDSRSYLYMQDGKFEPGFKISEVDIHNDSDTDIFEYRVLDEAAEFFGE